MKRDRDVKNGFAATFAINNVLETFAKSRNDGALRYRGRRTRRENSIETRIRNPKNEC